MKIVTYRNYWAIKITEKRSLFIFWAGKDTWFMFRSWEWTKFDFLDHVGFDRRAEFFGAN